MADDSVTGWMEGMRDGDRDAAARLWERYFAEMVRLACSRLPRHAKAYRRFLEEHRRLQQERIAAFREYIADVQEGRFPERSHLVEMEEPLLAEVMAALANHDSQAG